MLKKIVFGLFFLFSSAAAHEQVGLLTLGSGVLKPHQPRPCFFIEYKGIFPKWSCIRPQIGAMTENFHSLYVYAGAGIDFIFFDRLVLTPSFAPGLYFRGEKTVRLGFPIEFRSAFEIAWKLPCKARIGLEVFHLSNAHLSSRNPGVNVIAFFVSFPFGANCGY